MYERSISEEEKVKDDQRLRILKSENKKYLPVTYTAKFSVVFLFSYLKDKIDMQTWQIKNNKQEWPFLEDQRSKGMHIIKRLRKGDGCKSSCFPSYSVWFMNHYGYFWPQNKNSLEMSPSTYFITLGLSDKFLFH